MPVFLLGFIIKFKWFLTHENIQYITLAPINKHIYLIHTHIVWILNYY